MPAHGSHGASWDGPAPDTASETSSVILPISDTELPNAIALAERCTHLGLRAQVAGPERGSLGARIREARLVPYQAVIGAKEAADDHVALHLRDGRRLDPQPVSDALTHISALVGAHSTDLWADATS
jgi:threonyl-tRNA synthetase